MKTGVYYNYPGGLMLGSRRIVSLLFTLLLVAPFAFLGQVSIDPRPKPAAIGEANRLVDIRSDSNLVLVPVTVCDSFNRPVTGLEKTHFKVFDNKVEQTVTHFAMDDEPVAVGLVFDISGSMGPKLRLSRIPS